MEQELTKKEQYDQEREEQIKAKNKGKKNKQKVKIFTAALIVVALATLGIKGWYLLDFGSHEPMQTEPQSNNLLSVSPQDYSKGNPDAPATLIEYLDFECESCGAYYPVVKKLQGEFNDDLRVVTRYFPLPGHKNGMPAALAVEAAARQEKYWEMYGILFENQRTWGEKPAADPKIFEEYAQKIGLDIERFRKDVADSSVKARVERDIESGKKLDIQGTPSFFLNGEKIENPRTYEDFQTLIKAAILKAPKPELQKAGDPVHEHADFKVLLDGKAWDFTQAKYQSTEENPLNPDAHLHDGVGHVTHKHRKGVTLGYFFETIGMKFTKECFETDTEKYCNTAEKKLKFYINGQPNNQFGDYEFADNDHILISYGKETQAEIDRQLASITDEACIYSETCPERGAPPTEGCVGGLGTDCK